MTPLTHDKVDELLATAAGSVSYQSQYARTTAIVKDGRVVRFSYASDVLAELVKASYVAPTRPVVTPGPRSAPYTGPFPRGKHSHRCKGCATFGQHNAVACYKSQCTRPQLVATCEWCKGKFAGEK